MKGHLMEPLRMVCQRCGRTAYDIVNERLQCK
jgi:ribosomal protein L37E